MTEEKKKICCAVCRTRIISPGKLEGDILYSTYLSKRPGDKEQKHQPLAKKIGEYFVCWDHRDRKLIGATVGILVATMLPENNGKIKLETVTAVRRNGGFNINTTSFNAFGMRQRGYGADRVWRIATEEDTALFKKQKEKEQTQQKELAEANMERARQCNELVADIKLLLPIEFDKVHINAQRWTDSDYKVQFHVNPAMVKAIPVGRKTPAVQIATTELQTLKLFAFYNEDDGICPYFTREGAEIDWKDFNERGANGMTQIEEVNLIIPPGFKLIRES